MTSQAPTQGPTDAGLTARVLSSEWQPIETAPKDGTHVLGFGKHDGTRVMWWTTDYPSNGDWMFAYTPTDYIDGIQTIAPTHWMPLPTPPTNHKGAA